MAPRKHDLYDDSAMYFVGARSHDEHETLAEICDKIGGKVWSEKNRTSLKIGY